MRRPLPRLARLAAHVGAPAPNRAAAVELLEDEELLAPMTAAGLGEELQPLLDSAPALEDTALLRERLNDDGYLFLRGFHERADVMAARTELLEHLASHDDDPANPIFAPDTALGDAVFGGRHPSGLVGHRAWGGVDGEESVRPAFLGVVNSPKLMDFFSRLLGGPSATFDHKWLRVVPPGNANSAHADIVYMGDGARSLFTCWTPLGDVPLSDGPLAIALGSHRHPKLQGTYCQMNTHQYLCEGPDFPRGRLAAHFLGCPWASASFAAGDILIFSAVSE